MRQNRMVRAVLYLAAITAVVWILYAAGAIREIPAWANLVEFVLFVLVSALALRWFRRVVLWRLRNRLLVTYMFIGGVPVLVVIAMALITAYIFGGQFATFLVTSDLQAEVKSLEASNQTIALELAANLRRGAASSKDGIPALTEMAHAPEQTTKREVVAWFRGQPMVLRAPDQASQLAPPAWLDQHFSGVVREGDRLFLRALSASQVGNETVTVISSTPLDSDLISRVAGGTGEITFYLSRGNLNLRLTPGNVEVSEQAPQRGLVVVEPSSQDQPSPRQPATAQQSYVAISGGRAPVPVNLWDRDVSFAAIFPVTTWDKGEPSGVPFAVRTSPSLLYGRLFASLGEFATIALVILGVFAVLFVIIDLVALVVGIGLTRTITRSVANLYEATQAIDRGDLRHRIEVRSHDQLAELETSFNTMTGSLERLIKEQKEKERLQSELAIAQEVQSQLFPREFAQLSSLEVHGVCRPARIVSGDYFDFLKLGPGRLGIALGDISGKGISAALLMATVHSAVRAYEFGLVSEEAPAVVSAYAPGILARAQVSGAIAVAASNGALSPAGMLALLNRHLYRSTSSEKYATLFLSVYDEESRTLTYGNAGHLPPMVLGADGSVQRLDTDGLVIGLFENARYQDRSIELRPGDIFAAFSDGIIEPENEFGEFGEARLMEILRDNRELPLPSIAEAVTEAVRDWIGAAEQPDDVTLVLARAR
ncbi:MAG: PP2C family protein-serine/threonine phosphatase [Terriglobales bacterium]